MRNLKKVMALALATVMLFGMMVMGAGAADYQDADQIDRYETAIEVLKAIKVFEGTDAGYLNPKSTLTRAEAAVAIAKLNLTKEIAGKLGTSTTVFTDVDASYNWASAAIAYAQSLKIVSGMTETQFAPADTLTGHQYAKMLLVVLGYNPDFEKYTGAGWDANVGLDAIQAGLLNGMDGIDLGAAILRDEAIQMTYNALLANCVSYSDVAYDKDGNATYFNCNAKAAKANVDYNGSADGTLQFIESMYPAMKLVDTVNAYGYAQKTWKNGTTAVVAYDNHNVLKTYTGKVAEIKAKDLYADFALTATAKVDVYANNHDVLVFDEYELAKDGTKTPFAAYNGAVVDVLKNGTTKEIMIKYALAAQVTKVNAATAEKDATVDIKVYNEAGVGTEMKAAIKTEAYAKDQWLLVTLGKDATDATKTVVKSHAVAEYVYGTVTKTDVKDGKITAIYIDGTAVPVAGSEVATLAGFSVGKKLTVVTQNGYAVAVAGDVTPVAAVNLDGVYYVGAISDPIGDGWTGTYKTAKLIPVTGGAAVDQQISGAVVKADWVGKLVKVIDEKTGTPATKTGYKTFEAYTGVDAEYYVVTQDVELVGTEKSMNYGTPATKAYFTADSKIINVKDKGLAKVSATAIAAPAKVTITNAIVVVDANGAKADEVLYIFGENVTVEAATSEDLYYVVDGILAEIAVGTKTYYQVKAYNVKTGEPDTYTVAKTHAVTGFATATVTDGVYTFAAYNPANDAAYAKNQVVDIYGDLISIDGTIDNYDMSKALFINAAGNTTVTTVAKLFKDGKAATDFIAVYNSTAKTVLAFIVTA